jgi:hypothetical protein
MVIFDTLRTFNDLTKSGMTVRQATAITRILKGLIESQDSNLLTKHDLKQFSLDFKGDISELKLGSTSLGSGANTIQSEIKSIKWMLSIFGAIVMAAVVQHNFIHS